MATNPVTPISHDNSASSAADLAMLTRLEKQVLWLATYMIHNANHVRPNRDGVKIGGHQASSASLTSVMTALYFHLLKPGDRVAVKPHASPVFHAIQYLLGNQTRENIENFRAFGGAQSYPSRTKDLPEVDFSTGSVGLGVAATLFAAIVRDYAHAHGMIPDETAARRMIALIGDAELDEGNIYEALLEGWKHDVRNLMWIIDFNRQSLDGVVSDDLINKVSGLFDAVGWNVIPLKYGKRLEAARHGPAGEALIDWIDNCPNQLYSALTFKGGSAWRDRLKTDLKGTRGLKTLLDTHDDETLAGLMTNLGGHDQGAIIETIEATEGDERPHCLFAYTVKGYGLPLAGHKDNHAGLLTPNQLEAFQADLGIRSGAEWDPFSLFSKKDETAARHFLSRIPQAKPHPRGDLAGAVPIPAITTPTGAKQSTQEAFGKILFELAKGDSALAERIVTTSPDVTVSTNLGPWVNRRSLFARKPVEDTFKDERIPSTQIWRRHRDGQHLELGIAEHNLFLLLGQLGLSDDLFGARLLPIGTVYDPFINRGLDALNYACYQGARFMLVATPSGITLGPEGGAHQSIHPPVIGMAQPDLSYFEPAYVDELAAIMAWGFDHMQADDDGGSIYLRLSTRPIQQIERHKPLNADDVIAGAYWLVEPGQHADTAIIVTGAMAPEALAAVDALQDDCNDIGVLMVTSPDRLHRDWQVNMHSHANRLLSQLAPHAALVSLVDGAPGTLSWLGSVRGHRLRPLGLTRFGQVGNLEDLYRAYDLDADALVRTLADAIASR
ncbi:MAG: transketolase [Pseudomonadota bacterium]